MEIIAKTKDGYLIQASVPEVKEILCAVSGVKPDDIDINQKIPAIDYASTITKIKTLQNNYQFKMVFDYLERFNEVAKELKDAVEKANEIEI